VTPRSEQAPSARHPAGEAADAYALAESHRRAGRPADAERAARAGLERAPSALRLRVVLALALLEQGRADAAKRELEHSLGASAEFPTELSEQEFEAAFESAEPEAENLVDADRVAEQALREAELGPADEIGPAGADSVFATRTMAELLERQGDREGAARIRSRIERARTAPSAPSATDRRRQLVRELERWLVNLRKEA
jgi:tetratricopeptide (TPR) repeat protein